MPALPLRVPVALGPPAPASPRSVLPSPCLRPQLQYRSGAILIHFVVVVVVVVVVAVLAFPCLVVSRTTLVGRRAATPSPGPLPRACLAILPHISTPCPFAILSLLQLASQRPPLLQSAVTPFYPLQRHLGRVARGLASAITARDLLQIACAGPLLIHISPASQPHEQQPIGEQPQAERRRLRITPIAYLGIPTDLSGTATRSSHAVHPASRHIR